MTNPDPVEEIQNLKQRIGQLENQEETSKRSAHLLHSFNQASLAMSYATTPEEIFGTAAKALKDLGISSIIYAMDENQENLVVNSITLDSKGLKAAEKLAGFSALGFTIPIDPVDAFRISIKERRTHLSRDSQGILEQMLPDNLKKNSGKLAKLLNVPTSINAPLLRGDDVIGLLSVQAESLIEEDIPLVTAFAHQVASSWHKAQLYQQAQHEIAERIQIEKKLADEHNRSQQYLDIAGVFIVVLNQNGEIVLLNQKGYDVLGYQEDELVGKNWFDLIIPENEKEQVFSAFQQIISGDKESIKKFNNLIKAKNGELRKITWHNSLLTDNDGKIIGTLSSGEDITERVEAEKALRDSEARFKSIVEDHTEFLVRWLPDGTRTFVNDAYCRYFSKPREELIGENFLSVVAEEDAQIIRQQLESITLDAPISPYYEHRVRHADGTEGWLQWIDRGIFDQDGNLIKLQSVGRDITARVKTENALRESEKRFRSIVDTSPMGMHMYQLEADGRLIFIGSNPAADNILWVDNAQFIGKTIEEAFPQLANTEVPEKYRRAAADGESWQTTQISYEDKWITGAYEVYAVQTSPGKMTAIFQDITDKKRALQEQERLVSILEATSDVVGTATLEGRLVYLNQAGRLLFGLEEDTDLKIVSLLRARPITEFLKIEQESISAALLYGVWSGESVIIDPSNREIPVSIVLIVHHNSEGDAEFISAVIRDISTFHMAEDLIHLQSTALDGAATGIFIADHQGEIIWANPAITEITGFELDEIIGGKPEIFNSGQHDSTYYQEMSDTLAKGMVWRGELINRKKDGSTYISEQTITPVFDINEQVTHYISIQQNISDRKENEQALQQRAIQLALLNEIGEQIVAVLDLERIFQHVVNLVQESFGYHHVGIFTLEADEEMFVLRAKAGGFNDLYPIDHTLKLGQGLVGRAVETNQTLLSNDVTSDDRFINIYPDTLPTQSELCVPIYIGEEVIGVLDAQSPIKNAFDDSDITVMQTLAGQIAIAIENARLHTATERRLKETQAIATINQALIETLDLNRLLKLMVDSIGQIIPHLERVVAHLYHEENATLIPAAVAGIAPDRKPDLQMQSGQGIAGEVIKTGLPINVMDTLEDQRFIPIEGATYLRALLVVPIQSGARCLGTISVSSTVPMAFTNEDEHLLTMIGVQAALAIERAQLFEETQRRLAESNTLFYISNLIIDSEVPDVEAILYQIVDRLWLDFGFYHVHVYLIDRNSGALIANQGSGTIGVQLKEQGYRFTSEEGIVGYSASVGEAFMTNNLTDVLFFKPNPLLPHTSAEFAAPLRSRGQILGVLDILHQSPNRFDTDDFRFLTTVADQIAVVLDKALLYNQLQEALEKEQSTRAQLVQTEKLAAMGRLIASVAHELNNPLQAIQNALYLVKLEETLSDQATQDLQIAFDEGTRMAGLIARLRDTYRPVVATDYQTESVDILTEEVCKLLDTHLRHSDINLEFTPTPDLPKNSVIRDQIKQVILNLCLNAIESMPEGGKLNIWSNYQLDGDEVHLNISDTGPGITPEAQNKIFEPFFTTKEGGTGLGLAVSYEIVQNHGGSIEAKNNPGPGATFTLALPCKPLMLE